MSEFYVLEHGWASQFYWAHVAAGLPDDHVKTGLRGFRGEIHVTIIRGGRPGDLMGSGMVTTFVSDRVLDVLAENGFEAYQTIRVRVSGGCDPVPSYHGLALLGRGGRFLPEESGVSWGRARPDGSRVVMGMRRLVFDVGGWDGSDLFCMEEWPLRWMVTDRVVKAFKKAKLTNCKFTPVEEFSYGLCAP